MMFLLVIMLIFLLPCMALIARHKELSGWAKLSLFLNPLFLIFALSSTPIVSVINSRNAQRAFYISVLEEAASADQGLREKMAEILKDTSQSEDERLRKVIALLHGTEHVEMMR